MDKPQKAISIVQNAIDADTQQNFPEAVKLYQNALDYFMLALKCASTLSAFRPSRLKLKHV